MRKLSLSAFLFVLFASVLMTPEPLASEEPQHPPERPPEANLLALNLAQSFAVADFNGDGASDVAVADFLHDLVLVRLRDEAGRFTATSSLATGHGPRSIVVRDFDSDGALDVAVANFFSGDVQIFRGQDGRQFHAPSTLTLEPGMASLTSGDFDGDGDADLAVANFLSGRVSLLEASDAGITWRARGIAIAAGTTLIMNRDVNRDGLLDLVALDTPGTTARLFVAQGGGRFTDAGVVDGQIAVIDEADASLPAHHERMLQALSGSGQAARVGTLLPEALIVELRDSDGAVVTGEQILFASLLEQENGSGQTQLTNEQGQAALRLVAADSPESQFVAAAAPGESVAVAPTIAFMPDAGFRAALYQASSRLVDSNEGDRQRAHLDDALERLSAGDRVAAVRLLIESSSTGTETAEVLRRFVNQVLLIEPASPGPNLVETSVNDPPAVVTLKDKFTASDVVENEGTNLASPSTTRYYLSVDGVQKTTRLGGGGRTVPALDPGDSSSGSDEVTVPITTKPRSYVLLACADDRKAVVEDDEDDNCRASARQVEVRAVDLIVTAVSEPPPSISRGSSFLVTDTTKNNGDWPAGNSTTRYFLSLDKKRSNKDVAVASRIVSGLAPGASSTDSMTATVPTSTSPNQYFLLACADDLKKVPEGNAANTAEKNNCLASVNKVDVISGDGGSLANGALTTGRISTAGEIDEWTFTANTGDRIAVHTGEIVDDNDFRPWLRLVAPDGTILEGMSQPSAALVERVAPQTGTYRIRVASNDSGFDGTGTYRLTMTHTPGPIAVSPGDQGGPLTNGAMHTGEILQGDVDVWTFTANAGDRIAIHAGEITDTDDFRPWLRLWSPTGAFLGGSSQPSAAAIDEAAPVTGTYLVLVASDDTGVDGEGTYRLTMTHTPGPITVSPGDQGGPLTNGAMHIGEILQGDVDVWTFTANAGDRIAIHAGEITDTDDFRPWLRLWSPTGAFLEGSSHPSAAVIDNRAPVTGTYLVLVASFDTGFDGEGTYRLTMTHTPGPITVSPGDQGGPLTIGATHTGEIVRGDLDVWTVTVTAGHHVTVDITETLDNDNFTPWIRLWAPNGVVVGGASGLTSAQINDVVVPVTGTYLVLVGTLDTAFDGTGNYSLVVAVSPP